ncbi:MAG: ABC transporter substrate-binding protein [Anaerolineales bacterium]
MSAENVSTQDFDIFVSYSSQDKSIADAVVAAHEQAGIRCWYAPRDIAPGADWADSITKAIHDCSIMVLIFSKEANRSQRVIDEVNYAISQEKPLLPFRIESSNPTGALSLHLSSRHWLDAYDPGWEDHIERLVKSVTINLEDADETIQISGGEADSIVGERAQKQLKKQKSFKNLGYLAGGLIVVSLLGYFGWKYFGEGKLGLDPRNSTITLEESTPTESLPEPTEIEETSEVVPPEIPSYTAVLHGSIEEQGFSLDPQKENTGDLALNLFLTLTAYDYENAAVVPRAAESWTVSPDGRIYTFKLRAEIPWVIHALEGDTVQITDEDGSPRYVSAADFEYAYKRLCDPAIEDFRLRPTNIQGCSDVLEYTDPENIPPELFDEIGVEAISDTELIFTLEEPSGYFLTTTSNLSFSAVPAWALEKYSEAWTNPGLMPTNGVFVIDEWVPGERIRLVRNELLPIEVQGEGNIKTVELMMLNDTEAYEMWGTGQIDYASIPEEYLANHLIQNSDQTNQALDQIVYYLIFNLDQPPFDNIHLRRAFSAALNRTYFVNDILQEGGLPMNHLAPPGVFGAPPVDEVGVGYALKYARAELELAGYPQCLDLPMIDFTAFSTSIDKNADKIARSWEEGLDCPEGTINYLGNVFGDNGYQSEWDILGAGWRSDYPDEENWVGPVLYCDNKRFVERSCNEIDELIVQAREEINASKRIELYRQIEESFFGYEGTFPIAPLYTPFFYTASYDWVEYTQAGFWIDDYSKYWIDIDAKEAARGE